MKLKNLYNSRICRTTAKVILTTALAVSAFLPFSHKSRADELPRPASSVKPYPNFSGGGIHGNPAVWKNYGNIAWGGFEHSKKGVEKSSLLVNHRLFGESHVMVRAFVLSTPNGNTSGFTEVLDLPLAYGIVGGVGLTENSDGTVGAQIGFVHILSRQEWLLRTGLDFDQITRLMRAGSEFRFLLGPVEPTLSASARFAEKAGEWEYAGYATGVQTRVWRIVLSAGVDGTKEDPLATYRAHLRTFFTGTTALDLSGTHSQLGPQTDSAASVGLFMILP